MSMCMQGKIEYEKDNMPYGSILANEWIMAQHSLRQ